MHSHNRNKVIFAIEVADLVGAISRPKSWPSFSHQMPVIMDALKKLVFWKMENVSIRANKWAFLVSQSVTRDFRSQSYVAIGTFVGYMTCLLMKNSCPLCRFLIALLMSFILLFFEGYVYCMMTIGALWSENYCSFVVILVYQYKRNIWQKKKKDNNVDNKLPSFGRIVLTKKAP